MASYNGNIDLLALNGAKVFTGIDKENPKRAYVCVPMDLNEIKVTTSRNDPHRQIASLRVNIWPFNENYKNAVRRKAQERGDTHVNVPTHEMLLSYTVDYIKAAIKAFPKLVEEVRKVNKERDPDIVNQDPQDENTHLFKAIRARMAKRLAILYQPQAQQQQTPYPQPNYAQAGPTEKYVAPADGQQPDDPFTGDANYGDDLPF